MKQQIAHKPEKQHDMTVASRIVYYWRRAQEARSKAERTSDHDGRQFMLDAAAL